jgi:ABC-type dipeptide/oligopeptide/nickel transport system permease component
VGRFAARRLLQTLATLLVASFVFFSVVTLLPGDPVRALFGFGAPPREQYEAIREEFHLDEPFLTQYFFFVTDLAKGDLGYSYPRGSFGNTNRGPLVRDILQETVPLSARLLGATVAVQVLVGGILAVIGVVRRRPFTDMGVYAFAVILIAVPVIVSAYAFQAFVGLKVQWLPYRWIDGRGWTNYVLPVAALSAGFAAFLLLLGRAELLANMRAPFMRTTAALGIPRRRAVAVHAMRPSVAPIIAFLTANLGNLFTGLLIVESIFEAPGLGLTLFNALQLPDRRLTVTLLMLIVFVVIVANGLGDILSSMIDPRIRLAETD